MTKKLPGDKSDSSLRLIAVNGTKIETFGVREITLKIGRKSYKIPAIICDVQQEILGMDFINRYKLNLECSDDQTELMIVDRKAQIKEVLQIVTVPGDTPRVHSLDGESNLQGPDQSRLPPETVAFQVSCMKQLAEEESKVPAKKSVEEQLSTHDPKYQALIKKYPQLLNPDFVKGEPVHGVYHRIDTGSHAPCKAKRRPIIMNSAKAAAGKAAWEQMERDGVIERVQAGVNTDWTSALHLADKPGGGARPVRTSDYLIPRL